MIDDSTYETLNDYLDGLLPEGERAAFEARLSADAALQSEAEALRALRGHAALLPRELAPERDLWAGVAERIGVDDRPVISFRRSTRAGQRLAAWTYVMAAAAAILLILGAPTLLNRAADPAVILPVTVAGRPAAPAPDVELQRVTEQYLEARQELVALLEERKKDIAPETYAVVEENLTVIAAAVTEIETALAAEPESPKLERMLYAAMQSEVDLLQQAVKLADTGARTDDSVNGTKGEDDAV